MATTTTRLMTFAEFDAIPDPHDGWYELHHGELVKVGNPKFPHVRVQWQIRRLLEAAVGRDGVIKEEMPYRPLPEHESWRADVVYISKARWDAIEDYLFGAPEMVIEVLSPSNTADEVTDKRSTCLENGCREFWVVNPKRRLVEVSTPDERTITYKSGQEIPLLFGGALAVDAIFAAV